MKLKEKLERYSMGNRRFLGRYKKWGCDIIYSTTSDISPYWYFTCDKNDAGYNSLWDGLKYSSKEECHDACVEYIDIQEKIETN